jgi:hypothetical protein
MKLVTAVIASAALLLVWAQAASAADPVNGSDARCSDFRLELLGFLDFDVADEGWVWIKGSGDRYRSVSGVVTGSGVAYNDTPANHNSHDQNTDILVDAASDGVLSNVNKPNTTGTDDLEADDDEDDLRTPTEIELEWEIGTFPNEKGKSVPQRYLPRWAWPSIGDRVWAEGNWVFDCGHAKKIGVYRPNPIPGGIPPIVFVGDEYFRSEIHPPRAIAAMRNQADVLPGTGTTPVPVTATDLYIHGESGYIPSILNCGMPIILGDDGDSCATKTTPIAADYEFDICLPPRPSPDAELSWRVETGPANSVASHDPTVTEVAAPPGCANDDVAEERNPFDTEESYDLTTALHVVVALAGSGIGDVEAYARRIVAGWIDPPDAPLTHLRMTLDRVNVHDSGDGGIIASDDGELTFFFAEVDRAPNEWLRVADYADVFDNGNSVLNDYDPSLFGDSVELLTGALQDFYVRNGQDVGVHARVYDQDCYDNDFGDHHLSVTSPYVSCAIDIDETGNNDPLAKLDVELLAPDYHSDPALSLGTCPGVAAAPGSVVCNVTPPWTPRIKSISPLVIEPRPDYELDFTLAKLALANEDTSDLGVDKSCTHTGEVLVVGQPLSCTITIGNDGPGLPRGLQLTDAITGLAPAQYAIGTPTLQIGAGAPTTPCTLGASGFTCPLDTLRVGGTATVRVTITPSAPGTIVNRASVSTASTDPAAGNDADSDTAIVFQPVRIDVKPGATPNAINIPQGGLIPVAILTADGVDALAVTAASVCFGDAEAPAQRDCTEAHGTGHVQDVDRDRDLDLLLHYEVAETGIDIGDTSACLTGITGAGIHVYGCDSIKTQ